ncbi:methionyl-tRNA formyltransferase [Ulvibacterium sp.]|uniref:methionyl-tRNA formyltransferase n=1 Tax=Ulvibacterium sp. TaxID=2665914 RepID=UPI003CC6C6E9
MDKLRIGYFADGPWSHLAFERIIASEFVEVCFITPRFDTADGQLKDYAEQYGIDYVLAKNVNAPDFLELAKGYDCDLFVSMSFNQIFRFEVINLPKYGIINCHAGKLPFYRGRNILNWALINDEKEFGITVHYVDEGIDTGDIILQRTFPITDQDDYASLLEVAYVECANILYDALHLFKEGPAKGNDQKTIHPVGMYCGVRSYGDEFLNWNQCSRAVFNFVRAICSPGPLARCTSDGEEIKINRVRLIDNAPTYIGKPGQVLCKNKNGNFLVKTADSFVEVLEYEGKLRVGKVLKTPEK